MRKLHLGILAVFLSSIIGANAQSTGVNHPATDDLGRALPTYDEVGAVRPDKTVAMFYWTWHVGHSVHHKNYDLDKIITTSDMANDWDHPNWDPYAPGSYFFWAEPLFDYYDGKDQWVIRKQLEMLGAAGVDVLFFDATNGDYTWKEGYDAVAQVMAEMRADGVDVPQFAFMLNLSPVADTVSSLVQLYDDIYSLNKYQDSWFQWDGKPAIMAYPEVLDGSYNPITSGSFFNAVPIPQGSTAGMKFTAESSFSGVSVTCPSWDNNIGNLTLSLYAWNTDYTTSVAQTPVATQTYVNFTNGAELSVEFSQRAAGDYVWELNGATETVGLWKYTNETTSVTSYFNGAELTGDEAGDYMSKIKSIPGGHSQAKLDAIKNFFTFRPGQPAMEGGPTRNDQWGWLENAPQNGYGEKSPGEYELMTVGVAQNWSEQTGDLSAMNGPQIRGRSYTDAGGFSQLTADSYLHGYNFQEQWDRALTIDPDMIFITGWNEWVAGRYESWQGVENAFPDQFDKEYSRDIEPMKGGFGDNYYYQMISNIRKFKGMEQPEATSAGKSIAIDGIFTEWADVTPDFKASKGNTQHRDGYGYLDKDNPTQHLHYVDNSGRNDIVGSKVARDAYFLYFLVETAAPLTSHLDGQWMRLYIDTDRNKATGWEGYDFFIDSYAADGKATLHRTTGGWEEVGQANYKVVGTQMEIAIPRTFLSLPNQDAVDIEFKWMDNVDPYTDIMEVYTSGDVAPSGRFNYRYTGGATTTDNGSREWANPAASGSWHTAANWLPATVPDSDNGVLWNYDTNHPSITITTPAATSSFTASRNNTSDYWNTEGLKILNYGGNTGSLTVGGGTGLLDLWDYGWFGSALTIINDNEAEAANLVNAGEIKVRTVMVDTLGIPSNKSYFTHEAGILTVQVQIDLGGAHEAGDEAIFRQSGGTVNVLHNDGWGLDIGEASLAKGTYILDAGTCSVSTITFAHPDSVFEFNGGAIQSGARDVVLQGHGTVQLAATGTQTIEVAAGQTMTFGTDVTLADKPGEHGTLIKTGEGTLALNSTGSNSGWILVQQGILSLSTTGLDPKLALGVIPDATVHLGFAGTDTIAALTFDGATWETHGTWGALGSGAEHTSPRFSGTGLLRVLEQTPTASWAETYFSEEELAAGLADGTLDSDGDGLSNIAEFAIGGNPRSNDAASVLPEAEATQDQLTYIYQRRRDAASLGMEYGLSYKADIASTNDWIYVGGAWETGTNAVDAEYEAITNEVDISAVGNAFLRLEITVE